MSRHVRTPRLMAAALDLTARGWFIFPLRPRDKRPLPRFTYWEKRATCDPERIYRWWSNGPYNIGIATGPSNLFVIDCDVADDKVAWRQVGDKVRVLNQCLPQTFRVSTPSGGLHLYYRMPNNCRLRNTAGALGRHVDTRGIGGYVVGPGSFCRAGSYAFVHRSPVAELPSWITDALARSTSPALPRPIQNRPGVGHCARHAGAVVQRRGVGEPSRSTPVPGGPQGTQRRGRRRSPSCA